MSSGKNRNPITKPLKELIATTEKSGKHNIKRYISKPKLKEKEVEIPNTNFSDTLPTNIFLKLFYESVGDKA